MDIKKVFQYGLLIFLIIASYLFYYKYFADDIKKIERKETNIKIDKKNPEISQKNENENIIENLK